MKKIQLRDWLSSIPYHASPSISSTQVIVSRDLRIHHNQIEPGDLFLALAGEKSHGSQYATMALSRGASLILSDLPPTHPDLPWITIPNLKEHLLELVRRYYPVSWERIYTVGVTGTNGKSSIVAMLYHMMKKQGFHSAVTGTVVVEGPGFKEEPLQTTPHFTDLYRLLYTWQNNTRGPLFYCYEASSHALSQGRLRGIPADGAIITAVTHDHLDYHRTYTAYLQAKLKLVESEAIHSPGVLIHEANLPIPPTGRRSLAFGKGKDVEVLDRELRIGETSGTIRIGKRMVKVRMNLFGGFQLDNAAYALSCLHLLFSLDPVELARSLEDFTPPPGRMETVTTDPFCVVVDYAHTPDGLETVLRELSLYNPRHLVVVFGCGGDRDRKKRPQMGRIAAEHADLVILTSDNPRSEPPQAIIAEIRAGIPPSLSHKVMEEPDRRKAIALALDRGEKGDIVLIAGKGHERIQVMGSSVYPFSDAEEVRKWLRQ
jgi:UDP-N-acetylmuramyl-tripeptide synthetase